MLFWNFLTDFGDTAVTLPLAAMTLALLLAGGARRAALAWVLAVGLCGLSMALLKLAFGSCGAGLNVRPFSPSGHSALSVMVYGGMALLFSTTAMPRRLIFRLLAMLFAAGIALSRIMVSAHTPVEVVVGLLIGLGALVVLAQGLRREVLVLAWPASRVVALTVLLVTLMHGFRWPIESNLLRFGFNSRPLERVCALTESLRPALASGHRKLPGGGTEDPTR